MGHCHSSAQLCRPSKIFGAGGGTGENASPHRFSGVRERARSAGAWLLLLFVRFYQVFLSPFLGGACKFYPSCSHYASEAIERHGARLGFVLAGKRLLRCRPFTRGGYDPVPDEMETTRQAARGEEPAP